LQTSETEIELKGRKIFSRQRGLGNSRILMIDRLRQDVIDLMRHHTRQRAAQHRIAAGQWKRL